MASDTAPLVYWEGCQKVLIGSGTEVWECYGGGINAVAKWDLDVVDAGKDSEIYVVRIWNNKDQYGVLQDGRHAMEEVRIITKTTENLNYKVSPGPDGTIYDATNDPVGGRWINVHRPNQTEDITVVGGVDTPIWHAIGNGDFVDIKAKAISITDNQILGSGMSDVETRYAEIWMKIAIPETAQAGDYDLICRVEYKFV